MNCAESHDLLLDLAYGELPPSQATEVESHVAGCAACRAEKEQLDEARRLAAPLRELEEPPPGFDERILRAARAEAGMQAEGTPGPVVEVEASVKPLGLQATRLDPHARMRRGGDQARPRWGRRAAIVGSIAAAAGLAVVVTSSLTTRPPIHDEVSPIQVRAPGAPASSAVEEALPKQFAGPPASNGAVAPARRRAEPVAQAPQKKADGASAKGGRAELARAKREQDAQVVSDHVNLDLGERPPPQSASSAGSEAKIAEKAKAVEARRDPAPLVKEAPPQYADRAVASAPKSVPAMSPGVGGSVGSTAPRTADQLEEEASTARRRGDYVRAGSLYRDASALRKASEPARAAWDLAHAVECLAAGGLIAEAVASRKDLVASFPDQTGPRAAADSALRSVPLPPDEDKVPTSK